MPPSFRLAVALLALVSQNAPAQTEAPPALAVQRIAPHLVSFAGSQANFQNLVNGLSQGTAVQLVTVLPGGATQLVSFTPAGTRSPSEVAQLLEGTRQQLIGLGIGSPTGEQLGAALVGGVVPTPLSPAAQMQSAASGASAPRTSVSIGGVSVQTNVSDSPLPPNATSRSVAPAPAVVPGAAAAAQPPVLEKASTARPAAR